MPHSCSDHRAQMLGVKVEAWTIPTLHGFIAELIGHGSRGIISNHNLHSVYLYHRDPQMRAFYDRATAIHIDGMALVWVGKLLGYPLDRANRITYVDWVRPLMAEAQRHDWRVFYLGSRPGVATKAADILMEEFPGLQIATAHGYFDASRTSSENMAILEAIREYRPHFLLVGMGMPRQERWVLENLDHIESNVIFMAGACMDYVAGAIPTPPRWMGQLGLEWLYRLLSEPKRLWRRYLIEPWAIALLLAKDLFRQTGKNSSHS